MTQTMTDAVLDAERRRCRAMLDNDGAALGALLDERLRFSHATGAVDDRQAYLAKMAAGRITYRSIDWSEQQVIALGEAAALLLGRMLTGVQVEGADRQLDNRVISAWALADGAWRLVAFQSTPVKA